MFKNGGETDSSFSAAQTNRIRLSVPTRRYIMSDSCPLLCSLCRIQAKGILDDDNEVIVTCPSCGATNTLENAALEAAKYVANKEIDKMFRDALSGSRIMQYIPNPTPDPIPRFIREDQSH
jgi:hypothetical protein